MKDRDRANRKQSQAEEPNRPGERGSDGLKPRQGGMPPQGGPEEDEDIGAPGEEILTEPGPQPVPAPGEQDEEAAGEAPSGASREIEYLDNLRRLTAEFANYRRRIQRERVEWEARAKADLLTVLLPILDDLDRARAHYRERPIEKDAEGLWLIVSRLDDVLRSAGLEAQATEPGTPFDPHVHEAIATIPSDEYPEGAIADTVQPGYLYKGVLIRPARVRVSQGPAGEGAG